MHRHSSISRRRIQPRLIRHDQAVVFSYQPYPIRIASTAAIHEVLVSDTAIHKRFTEPCAHFLHAVLEELTEIVVQADQEVPVPRDKLTQILVS